MQAHIFITHAKTKTGKILNQQRQILILDFFHMTNFTTSHKLTQPVKNFCIHAGFFCDGSWVCGFYSFSKVGFLLRIPSVRSVLYHLVDLFSTLGRILEYKTIQALRGDKQNRRLLKVVELYFARNARGIGKQKHLVVADIIEQLLPSNNN